MDSCCYLEISESFYRKRFSLWVLRGSLRRFILGVARVSGRRVMIQFGLIIINKDKSNDQDKAKKKLSRK